MYSNPTPSSREDEQQLSVDRGNPPHCPQHATPDMVRSLLLPESFSTWGGSFSTQLAFNGPDAQSQGSAGKLLKPLPGAGVASWVWNVSAFPLTPPPLFPLSLPIRGPDNLVTFHNSRQSSFSLGIRDFEIPKESITAWLCPWEKKAASERWKELGSWATRAREFRGAFSQMLPASHQSFRGDHSL